MTTVVYLCAVENHQTRVWSESGQRLRCQFPKKPWFLELVQEHDLAEWLSVRNRNDSVKFALHGIMSICPGISADDLLSEYPKRSELGVWRSFWTAQGSLYTVLVKECLVFQEPQEVHTYLDVRHAEPRPLRGRPNALSPFLPSNCKPERMLNVPGVLWQCDSSSRIGNMTVQDALQRWGLELTEASVAVPVVQPVAGLIVRGAWSSVGLLGHWTLPQELFETADFPPDELKEKLFRQEPHWSTTLSHQQVSLLADRVRSWAPVLLTNSNEEAAGLMQLELADMIQWFETLQRNLEHQPRPSHYPSHVMIAAVFLAFLLGSRTHMAEAIPLALKLALPGLDFDDLAKHVKCPKTTTLARASTYMDFAYLMLCRERWKQTPHLLFAWADSSPQSGREWFMSMEACIPESSLIETFQVVNKLIRARPDLQDHFESRELDLDELLHCSRTLQANLLHHKNIPVAMASGKTRLEDKVSCLLHVLALESDSRAFLTQQLSRVVSWTTDLGLEVQVPQFQAKDPETLVPTWLHASLPVETDVQDIPSDSEVSLHDGDGQNLAAAEQPRLDTSLMPSCLIVPGLLHVCHNLAADLHEKMQLWEPFWEQLKDVAELLAERHLRERLINQCVRGSAAAHLEPDFQQAGMSKLYEKRWQNVISCLDCLMPLLEPLRQVWNYDTYVSDSGIDRSVLQGVDKALGSPMFFHYLHMVWAVHKLVFNFECWVEGCPCHHEVREFSKKRKFRLHRRKPGSDVSVKHCPMKGKRSCELAVGCINSTFEELTELAHSSFMGIDVSGLPALTEDHRNAILRDFEYARAYLQFGLKSKLAFWETVPWRLCGLGHHFDSVARNCAAECLAEFDKSLEAGRVKAEHHHPLSVKFLSPGGPLRQSVEAFSQGSPMSPDLLQAVAPLKFVPCVERVVEGLHRDVKIASKHVQLGPTKVSMTVRLPEIKRHVQESPEFLSRLTAAFDQMRNLKKAAAMLGVLQHPELLQLLHDKVVSTTDWWIRLQKIVHRCDLSEQFADYREARVEHDKITKKIREETARVHDAQALPTPRTYDAIFKRAIVDHFRKMSDSSCFFSLPSVQQLQADANGGCYEILPLQTVHVRAQAQLEALGNSADVDVLEPNMNATAPDHMVFRVLHGAPENLKLAPGSVALKPIFPKGSSVVTVHDIIHDDESSPAVNMSALAAPQLLKDLEHCPLSTLREHLRVWKVSGKVQYTLPCVGFPGHEVLSCVTAILDAKALPDEPYVQPPLSSAQMCRALAQNGLLQILNPAPGRDSALVRFTQEGVRSLRVVTALGNPAPVCSMSSQPSKNWDVMELMLAMENDGWVWQPLPKSKSAKQALCYKPGDAKVWYSLSHFVNKTYLQCLLKAENIFAAGAVDRIPHWTTSPSAVYTAILAGKPIPMPSTEQQGLLDDDDVDIGDHAVQDDVHQGLEPALAGLEVLEGAGSAEGRDEEHDELVHELERLIDQADSEDEVVGQDARSEDDGGGIGSVPLDEAETSEAMLPPPPPPAAPPPGLPRNRPAEEDNVSVDSELEKPPAWGVFRINLKQPAAARVHGGYEARCPFHRKSAKTDCKKFVSIRGSTAADKDNALRALKAWCNCAESYNRQRDHIQHFVSPETAPSQAVLDAGLITQAPPGRPRTDEELDRERDAAAAALPAHDAHADGGAVGVGGAAGAAVSSAKAKARGRGSGAEAEQDPRGAAGDRVPESPGQAAVRRSCVGSAEFFFLFEFQLEQLFMRHWVIQLRLMVRSDEICFYSIDAGGWCNSYPGHTGPEESEAEESREPIETPKKDRGSKRRAEPSSDKKSKASTTPKDKRGRSKTRSGKPAKRDSRGTGRHEKRQTKEKGKKHCKSCGKSLPLSSFAINQSNCLDCKKCLDVLSKKCRACGKSAWLAEVKQCPKRLKALINAYRAAVVEAKSKGQKTATFSVITYIETTKASSAVESVARGTMMWQDQAVEHFQTPAGGSLSKAAAEAKWKSMSDSAEADGTITDTLGPKQAPLRLRIHIGDDVNFVNKYSRSKPLSFTTRRVEAVGATKKKGTEEDVRKLGKNLMLSHESVAGARALSDVANDLAGGLGMEGHAAALGDVEALCPASEPEASDDSGSGDDSEKSAGEDKPAGRKSWFDRDREVNKAAKIAKGILERLCELSKGELQKMVAAKREYDSLRAKDKKQLEGDHAIMLGRQKCLEAVLDGPSALANYISSFDAAADDKGSVKSESVKALGSASPSRTFRDLRAFSDWEIQLDKINECESVEAIEEQKAILQKDFKNPIADLVSAAKSALSDLQRGLKVVKKAAAGAAAKAASGTSKKKATASVHGPAKLFQAADHMASVSVIAEGEELSDFDSPAIIRSTPEKLSEFEASHPIKKAIMQEFAQLFSAQASAQRVDRAHKRFAANTDVYHAMASRMGSLLRQAGPCSSPEIPQDVKAAMDVQAVIVAKNVIKIATEKHQSGWALT
ncbi:unnamed protein product [Symbiodinium sp. CCMP2592]|nr:unnamed protein product [Symbiodinium sp. CCMP2592]